jgi:putative transposase
VALPRDVVPATGVGLKRQGGSALDVRGLALLASPPDRTRPGDPCNNVIGNLFHLRRDHVTASEYRAARARAFETWAEISGVAAAA